MAGHPPSKKCNSPPGKRHKPSLQSGMLALAGILCTMAVCILFWSASFGEGFPVASAQIEEPASSISPEPVSEPEPQPIVEEISFSATGDNLIHSPIYKQAAARATGEETYSFDACYEHLTSFYSQFDVNWINQETLCSKELAPSTYPCFSTPGECAEALYRAGIRVFSLSNNHTYDKGSSGIAATLRFWAEMPEDVVTTGLWYGEADYGRIPLHTINGITIAYLSYTEHTNGIRRSDKMEANIIYTSQTDVIQQQVTAAAELADFVVVGTHWGVEDSHTIIEAQQTLAQQLADWGADLVIGTHPHVLQDAQWLTAADGRKVFVAYSLGNFLSTQSKKDQLIGAILSLGMKKTTEPDGTVHLELIDPKLHPIVTHYGPGKTEVRTYLYRDYTPELAATHGVRGSYSDFSYEYVRTTAEQYISSEFLDLS